MKNYERGAGLKIYDEWRWYEFYHANGLISEVFGKITHAPYPLELIFPYNVLWDRYKIWRLSVGEGELWADMYVEGDRSLLSGIRMQTKEGKILIGDTIVTVRRREPA